MKNILITGANGQLGNEMRVLATEHPEYTYFFTDVEELDICDEQAVTNFVQDNAIDCIVNCAAYTAVDKAEENEDFCDKLNHIAPGYLAKAAASRGAALIQVSTDYVFDGTNHIPYRETEPTCPNSVYGRTKLAGEQEAMSLCERTMIIRTAWLYSTFGNNFVNNWVLFLTKWVLLPMLVIWLVLSMLLLLRGYRQESSISVTKVSVRGTTSLVPFIV